MASSSTEGIAPPSLATTSSTNTTSRKDSTPPQNSTTPTKTNITRATTVSDCPRTSSNMVTSDGLSTPEGLTIFGNPTTSFDPKNTTDLPADDAKRHIFPFFDLPRELRDLAYEQMLVSHFGIELKCHLKLDTYDTMQPKLMTVSRQFADEYQECAEKRTACLVQDGPLADLRNLVKDVMPLKFGLKRAQTLKINIAGLVWCAELHKNWIGTMVSAMPFLKSFSVKFVLTYGHVDDEEDVRDHLRNLVTLQKLAFLEVYLREKRTSAFPFDQQKLLVLKWSSLSGSWEISKVEGIDPVFVRVLESL